jgi:hypothetical protein
VEKVFQPSAPVMSAFEILQEKPRPFLDTEALKAKFLRLSTPVHPDRVHHLSESEKNEANRNFSELNQAHQILREPRERLRELYRVSMGESVKKIQNVPSELMDLSFETGKICREVDVFVQEAETATSPLQKAVRMSAIKKLMVGLEKVEIQISAFEAKAMDKLLKLDQAWVSLSTKESLLNDLENLISVFSYLYRSKQQLTDRTVQLKTLL